MNISLWTRQYLFLNFMTAGGGYGTLYSGQRSSCLLLIHSPQAAASLVPHRFQVRPPGTSPLPGASSLYRCQMPRHYQVQVAVASPLQGTGACASPLQGSGAWCLATTKYNWPADASPLLGRPAWSLPTTRCRCLMPRHYQVQQPCPSPLQGTAAWCLAVSRYSCLVPRHYRVDQPGALLLRVSSSISSLVPRHYQVLQVPGALPLQGTTVRCLATTRWYRCLVPCYYQVQHPVV
jgi:hypothetical protein